MSTYKQTLEYLFHALPAYHRVGAAAYKANLDNTLCMMEHLDHPERAFKVIHVAGTNGKGSVSHMLAAILHRAGYKVGLYTSPHLVDFRERVRINGHMVSRQYVIAFVEKHRQFFEQRQLSFFEMTVGLAFDYFRAKQVDVAVVEVGMGGRLDSTNVVSPDLSIITNIGLDHTQFLGNTLAAIAAEKAGIIKPHVPVVIGETHPETAPVFKEAAKRCQSTIVFADQQYQIIDRDEADVMELVDICRGDKSFLKSIRMQLGGVYQRKNLATVCAAWQALLSLGYTISTKAFRNGVAHVVDDTGLRGRWEQLAVRPRIFCETAHNVDGIVQLVDKLTTMKFRRLHIVYGCVNDKDYSHILRLLPEKAIYYYTRPSVERGLDEKILAETASTVSRPGEAYPDVRSALEAVCRHAGARDLVIVTGSIFLVADLLANVNVKELLLPRAMRKKIERNSNGQ